MATLSKNNSNDKAFDWMLGLNQEEDLFSQPSSTGVQIDEARFASQEESGKSDKYSPYFSVEDGSRLTHSQVKRHEIVLTEEGEPIPNPMTASGLVPLLPTSLYDLAFETLLTGMSYAEGVDPRVAIATGLVAGGVVPKLPAAARAANIKGGAYLTRKAIGKGFEAVKKDPMFADIPFEKVSKFLPKTRPLSVTGSYNPTYGKRLMMATDPKEVRMVSEGNPVFKFQEQSLVELLASPWPFGQALPGMPTLFKPKWAESLVRHEGRHYKQNIEGLRNKISKGNWEVMERPLTSWGGGSEYSTLIDIPKPKNWKKIIPERFRDSKGNLKSPNTVYEEIEKEGLSNSYARRYVERFRKKITDFEYVTRHIEVEARIEEIASLGKKNWHANRDLIKRAGFTKNQIENMVSDYQSAKIKKYPYKESW